MLYPVKIPLLSHCMGNNVLFIFSQHWNLAAYKSTCRIIYALLQNRRNQTVQSHTIFRSTQSHKHTAPTHLREFSVASILHHACQVMSLCLNVINFNEELVLGLVMFWEDSLLIRVTPAMKSPPPFCAIRKNENWYCFLYRKSASPFDCLSLLLAWCYYWQGFLAFIIHFYAAIFSWKCYRRPVHLVALFMRDWFVGCWSFPPPPAPCRLGGSTRLLIHKW